MMTNHTSALNEVHSETERLSQLVDTLADILMGADHENQNALIACVNKSSALATIARDRLNALDAAITAALDADQQEAA